MYKINDKPSSHVLQPGKCTSEANHKNVWVPQVYSNVFNRLSVVVKKIKKEKYTVIYHYTFIKDSFIEISLFLSK